MDYRPVCRGAIALLVAGAAFTLSACVTEEYPPAEERGMFAPRANAPVQMAPAGMLGSEAQAGAPAQPVIDLTREGSVVRGTCVATIYDTRLVQPQIQPIQDAGAGRLLRDVLPAHGKAPRPPQGPQNDLPLGGLTSDSRAVPGAMWPGISATAWTPPDPALAVGPNHVVETVNMRVAFFTKEGVEQFAVNLDNTGNPGFFEGLGAGNFTFDPKCFYDHYAGRFVIVALEVYGSTQAWIDIAVSDDSDPNGVWYKYRTDAVLTVGTSTYWWDYPGFGFDDDAYYVTGNLFGLNNGGFGGVGFRVFDKAPLLSGQTAVYSTQRDGNAASVQSAQHFGNNQAAYFVSANSDSSMRIHAIRNPLTTAMLTSTTVTVPSYNGPSGAPNTGGSLSLVDSRIMNVHWRDGKLYSTHGVNAGGRNQGRWYQMNTNNWPQSGSVTLAQSGNVDGGSGVHTFFPAIYSNRFNDVGMVVGRSTSSTTPSVAVTGRRATDAAGTMAPLSIQFTGSNGANGRWGDYFDIAVDPVNDTRFWIIGEYQGSGGWGTWIGSFLITCPADFNGDGFVNGLDFDAYVGAFESGQASADFNGDGFVNGIDYDEYVGAFEAGC